MKLDVTITACVRPDLLMKTLDSFFLNLLWQADCRIIINVDPVGWSDDPETMEKVCRYYSSEVISNFPDRPGFGKAFKWAWDQAETDYVFHLEDDWKLLRKVSLSSMVEILEKNSDLASLRLPQFKTDGEKMKNWNLFFPWNGQFYECPKELRIGGGFCGHPSLIKGVFVQRCRILIDENKNPEKQFHTGNKELVAEHLRWRYGVYAYPGDSNYIEDMGRKWVEYNGWKKKGSKAYFTVWEPA